MKTCTKCLLPQSTSEFYDNPRTKDGLGSWCKTCENKRSSEYQQKHRLRALAALGNKCQRCEITDLRVLAIDHPKGGGRADRKSIGGGNVFYKYVAGHPEKYQALCHNCNHIKRIEQKEHRQRKVR